MASQFIVKFQDDSTDAVNTSSEQAARHIAEVFFPEKTIVSVMALNPLKWQ